MNGKIPTEAPSLIEFEKPRDTDDHAKTFEDFAPELIPNPAHAVVPSVTTEVGEF